MRATFRNLLIDAVDEVRVGPAEDPDYATSRVFEPFLADAKTPTPFIVFGEAERDPNEAAPATSTALEVRPFVDRTNFRKLDVIVDEITEALSWHVFEHDAKTFVSEVVSVSEDALEVEWGFTKPVRIDVHDLSMFTTETFEPDPIAGLRTWAEAKWDEVQVDPTQWTPSDEEPGVLFRLGPVSVIEYLSSVTWYRADVRAHVIAPSRQVRLDWTRKVTEGLANARHVALGDGSFFYLEGRLGADAALHPIREGQIALQGRFGVLVPQPEVPPLVTVGVSGDVAGDVDIS